MRLRVRLATAVAAVATMAFMGAGPALAETPAPVVQLDPGGYFSVGSTVAEDGSVPLVHKWKINAPGGVCREAASVSERNSGDVYASFDRQSSNVPTSIAHQDPAWGDYSNGEPGLDVDVAVTDCLGQTGSAGAFSQVYYRGKVTFGSGWVSGSCACWVGGSTMKSTRAGQTVTYTARGNGFAVVGDYAPGRGTADIYVDGRKVTSIDTARATTLNRAIIWQTHFNTYVTHTIKVVVTKGRVDIDRFMTTES